MVDIKAVTKYNTWYKEKKCGEQGFNPTLKYGHIWDSLTFNMNISTKRSVLDFTVDGTACAKMNMYMSRKNLEQDKMDNKLFSWIKRGDLSMHQLCL